MTNSTKRVRFRELGLTVGVLPTGPLNAITDVTGVRVGHVTLIEDAPHVIRSGVTAILPLSLPYWEASVFGGLDVFNGFGEVTGSHWIREAGVLSSPIVLTSTFSLGVARDTLLAHTFGKGIDDRWHQPCTAETFDGVLNDGLCAPVTRKHIEQAVDNAVGGPVAEGAVGGGTGMISFEFKAGIGTASRLAHTSVGTYTVGVLVQANFGNRHHLTVDGVPVGRHLGYEVVDSPLRRGDEAEESQGSIVIVVATDAPLLPPQLNRLARRAGIGLTRVGGYGNNRSGDFTLAFSIGNVLPFGKQGLVQGIRMLANEEMNSLSPAAAEATEEAILNSMTGADAMRGVRGTTVHALPLPALLDIMARYGRGPARS